MDTFLDQTARRFAAKAPAVDSWSLRLVSQRTRSFTVRQDIVQPPDTLLHRGAFVAVADAGGMGYAATSDLSPDGLHAALARARAWALLTARWHLLDASMLPRCTGSGRYETPVSGAWQPLPVDEIFGQLRDACLAMKVDERVLDRSAGLTNGEIDTLLVSGGGNHIALQINILCC